MAGVNHWIREFQIDLTSSGDSIYYSEIPHKIDPSPDGIPCQSTAQELIDRVATPRSRVDFDIYRIDIGGNHPAGVMDPDDPDDQDAVRAIVMATPRNRVTLCDRILLSAMRLNDMHTGVNLYAYQYDTATSTSKTYSILWLEYDDQLKVWLGVGGLSTTIHLLKFDSTTANSG